jgi:hypothetical protein
MLPRCSTVGDVSIASPLDPTVSWAASFLRRSRLRHWQPLDYRSRNAASEGWGHDEVRRIIRSSGYLYSSAPDVDGGGQLSWKATSAWQWLAGRPAARPRACLHEQNVGGNPERRTTTQRNPAHASARLFLRRLAAGGSVWGVGGPLKERGIPPRDPQAKRGVSAGIFGGRDGTEHAGSNRRLSTGRTGGRGLSAIGEFSSLLAPTSASWNRHDRAQHGNSLGRPATRSRGELPAKLASSRRVSL